MEYLDKGRVPRAEAVDALLDLVLDEMHKAHIKFPWWPDDAVHAAGIMVEEAGETMQAALDFHYGKNTMDKLAKLKKEAVQTAAMCMELLVWLNDYVPAKQQLYAHVKED